MSINRIRSSALSLLLAVVTLALSNSPVASQTLLWTRYHYSTPATCVRVSPDAHSVAVGMNDTTLLVYSLDNAKLQYKIGLAKIGIASALDFLSDGRIIVGTTLGKVAACDPVTGSIIQITGLSGTITSIDARSTFVGAASNVGEVVVVNTDFGILWRDFVTATPNNHIAISSDSKRIVYSAGRVFKLITIPLGRQIDSTDIVKLGFPEPPRDTTKPASDSTQPDSNKVPPILDVAFSPDGTRINFSQSNTGLFYYSFKTDTVHQIYRYAIEDGYSTFNNIGNRIAFRNAKGVGVFDFDSETVIQTIPGLGHISGWALDPLGGQLVLATFDGLDLISIKQGLEKSIWGHDYAVSGIAATSKGSTLITVDGAGGIYKAWNVETGLKLWSQVDTKIMAWKALSIAADDTTAIIPKKNDQAGLYRVSDGSLITSLGSVNFKRDITTIALSGDRLYLLHTDSMMDVWSVSQRTLLSSARLPLLARVAAVSQNNHLLAAANETGLCLYDLTTGLVSHFFEPQPDYVHSLEFSKDETELLVGTNGAATIYKVTDLSRQDFQSAGFAAYNSRESKVISVSSDSSILTSDINGGRTSNLKVLIGDATAFVYIPGKNYVAVGTVQGDVQMLSLAGLDGVRAAQLSSTIGVYATSDHLHITGLYAGKLRLRLVDLAGREVFQDNFLTSSTDLSIATSTLGRLPSGAYLALIETDHDVAACKVLIGK